MKKQYPKENDKIIKNRKPKLKENNNEESLILNNNIPISHEITSDIYELFKINKKEYNLGPFIIVPNIELINNNNGFMKKKKFLYHKVLTKEKINITETKIYDVQPDGDCFFRNISLFFTNSENYSMLN